jgi:uncharacterized protein (DUF427 family)
MSTTTRGAVRTEPSHKRVRIFFGGKLIVDSTDALYVWEGPNYPQYFVPMRDVAEGVLVPSPTTKRSPSRGTATFFDVRAGRREAPDSAWSYGDSPFDELRGRVRFEFDAMDAWFEEDEEIFVHPGAVARPIPLDGVEVTGRQVCGPTPCRPRPNEGRGRAVAGGP